jgi:DNA recombination protein RmuC
MRLTRQSPRHSVSTIPVGRMKGALGPGAAATSDIMSLGPTRGSWFEEAFLDIVSLLALLAVVAATVAAVLAWRAGLGRGVAIEELVATERRLIEALDRSRKASDEGLDRLRETLGEAMRAEAARSQSAQADVALRLQELGASLTRSVEGHGASLSESVLERLSSMDRGIQAALTGQRDAVLDRLGRELQSLRQETGASLEAVRVGTEHKLESIRATVDDRLQATLEARLGESFRQVSEQLQHVFEGLGEMRTLARGVGDLQRVLTNVRSRGTFGEVQLGALLEQVLTPDQYERNVATVPGSSERVEFAIRLPGQGDGAIPVWLPVDAKFPQEDYLRLQQALEVGDGAAADAARKGLRARALLEAATIREKYVRPPHTTDFALLFLPTEGLYAELLRIDGLTDELQQKHRVVAVGPTNLYALLASLQMGFKTLAIEKRSSDVWRILGAVKTEFSRFGDSLDAVRKKLEEAGNRIDDAARRSRAVTRQLREVESLPETEARNLLADAREVEPED